MHIFKTLTDILLLNFNDGLREPTDAILFNSKTPTVLGIARPQSDSCTGLVNSFLFENTTVINASRVAPGANFSVAGSCQSSAVNGNASICRVELVTNTTESSRIHMEAWLPDTWYGRFMGLGNGGLGGCIDYENLPYTTSLNFATISSDNGHDGNNGAHFFNQPEVLNDFAWRSIHTEALVGKALVQAYYGRPHDKSYYLGCSTGGRQGIKSAERFPGDFDGIIAGAPAVDWNHFLGWSMYMGLAIGAPGNTSSKFIPPSLWPIISQEILNQCDGLDGLIDGIITEPDACYFRPEALACTADVTDKARCLTRDQIYALHKIYSSIFMGDQHSLFPRNDPGSEEGGWHAWAFSGKFIRYSTDWFRYVVYKDPEHDFTHFNLTDIALNDQIDVGEISTFSGNLSAFNARGGKLLTYHGRRDALIPSGNSKRLYDRISEVMSMPNLDSFYRLFLAPGVGHCGDGQVAWAFGQYGLQTVTSNSSDRNLLLALVEWVENNNAPESIIGSNPGNSTSDREHCRYPQRSLWDGTIWICVS